MMKDVTLVATRDPNFAAKLVEIQGFALIENFVSPELCESMKAVLECLIEIDLEEWGENPHYRDHWMVMNLMFRDRLFIQFLNESMTFEYASQVLDESVILYSFTSSSMPPGGTNYSRRIHADSPRVIPGYPTNLGLIIPLDDFTEANGATLVLPHSHTLLEPPTEQDFEAGNIALLPKVGQALLFNARLWHAGGKNSTSSPRHALTVNLCRSFMRTHFDFSRMITEEYKNVCTERTLGMFGWNVRMPTSLQEYYVAPEDRLYKPGQG